MVNVPQESAEQLYEDAVGNVQQTFRKRVLDTLGTGTGILLDTATEVIGIAGYATGKIVSGTKKAAQKTIKGLKDEPYHKAA